MNNTFAEHLAADARLIILRALAEDTSGRHNEVLLQRALETYGLTRNREFVRTQMRALADLGAVTVHEAGTVLIATISRLGLDHVEQRARIEGVARPSPGA
jgi:hypothetical protein